MDTVDFDKLRLSYESMLEQRELNVDQLRGLAATLFLASFATAAQCEEALGDRDITEAELATHIDAMSASLSHGNVLATLDFLRELPQRLVKAREAGLVAARSNAARVAVSGRTRKQNQVRAFAKALAEASQAQTKPAVLDDIVSSVMDFHLKTTGRRMSKPRARATISAWLLEDGFVAKADQEETSSR